MISFSAQFGDKEHPFGCKYTDMSFKELLKELSRQFGVEKSQILVQYRNRDIFMSILSDEDLEDCLQNVGISKPIFLKVSESDSCPDSDEFAEFEIVRDLSCFTLEEFPMQPLESVQHASVECTSCKTLPIKGIRYSCTICLCFNLCQICEQTTTHPNDHPLLKMKTPSLPIPTPPSSKSPQLTPRPILRSRRRRKCIQKLFATYVRDITIPDGSVLTPGSSLEKSWSLKNAGENDWPSGVSIQQVSGDSIFEPCSFQLLPAIPAQRTFVISLQVCVPLVPGRYRGHLRLVDLSGQLFGPRFWVDFSVPNNDYVEGEIVVARVVEKALVVAKPAVDVEENISRFSGQLSMLEIMGFDDRSLNLFLLDKMDGDVQAVKEWWLAQKD